MFALTVLSVNDHTEAVAAAPAASVGSAVLGGVSRPSVQNLNYIGKPIGKPITGPTSILKPQCGKT